MSFKFKLKNQIYTLFDNWYIQYDYPTLVEDYVKLCHCTISGNGNGHSGIDETPALPTQGSKVYFGEGGFGRMYVDNTSPTVVLFKNNKKYYCAKNLFRVSKVYVNYNGNESTSGSIDSQSFYAEDGESVIIKGNSFVKTDYSFQNWNTQSDGKGTTYSVGQKYSSNSNLNLYAIWKALAYSISYSYSNSNGVQSNSNPTSYTVESDTITFDSPTMKTGYSFGGWTPTQITKGSSGNKTITGKVDLVNYSISYNYDVASRISSNSNPTSYTVESNTITFGKPSIKAGYSFNSWSPANIAKGSTGNKTITGSTSVNSYTISYDYNGGSYSNNPNPTSYTVESNDIVFTGAPTYSQKYLAFNSWNPSKISKGSIGNKTIMATIDYLGPIIESLTYTTSRSLVSSSWSSDTLTRKYSTEVNVTAHVIGDNGYSSSSSAYIWFEPCYFNGTALGLGGRGQSIQPPVDYKTSGTVTKQETGNIAFTAEAYEGNSHSGGVQPKDTKSITIPITNVETIKPTVWTDPRIATVTSSDLSYGSWSSWKYLYTSGNYKYYNRSRGWSLTLTVIVGPATSQASGSYAAWINKIGTSYGDLQLNKVIEFNSTQTYTYKISGSGSDISKIYVYVYNKNGSQTSSSYVTANIDAYDTKSERAS